MRQATAPSHHPLLLPYVTGVGAAGLLLLVVLCVLDGPELAARADAELWVFAGFVLLGELFPIPIPRQDASLTVSTTFAFALLFTHGLLATALVAALAVFIADVVRRAPLQRALFNVGQYTLSYAATAAALAVLTGGGVPVAEQQLPASTDLLLLVAAGAVFFAVNHPLAALAPALHRNEPIREALSADLAFETSTTVMLVGLAPVVVVVARVDLALVPLLALPLAAVYLGGRAAAAHDHGLLHDPLTGLPNRALFRDRVARTLLAADGADHGAAVVLVDIDHFEDVNDALGNRHGDALLQAVGRRLSEATRPSDTVARVGGDEFGVLLAAAAGPDAAAVLADRVMRSLQEPFAVAGTEVHLRASAGLAVFPEHAREPDPLVQCADVALHEAKRGRAGVVTYAPAAGRRRLAHLSLAGELRRALDGGDELELFYQPKVRFRADAVTEVEALVRWRHPTRDLLGPGEFLPVADHVGLMPDLTRRVIDLALDQVRAWDADGLRLDVAINVSGTDVLGEAFPALLAARLEHHGVAPGRMTLELTEDTAMDDPDRVLAVLDALRDMGVRLSIDDFGTGYSSLAYLSKLPVSELKIDRSFVSHLDERRSDAMIVRSTIDLARNLGLDVVAEGVESEAVLRRLEALGCTAAQGFHIARPIPAGALARWLRNRSAA